MPLPISEIDSGVKHHRPASDGCLRVTATDPRDNFHGVGFGPYNIKHARPLKNNL